MSCKVVDTISRARTHSPTSITCLIGCALAFGCIDCLCEWAYGIFYWCISVHALIACQMSMSLFCLVILGNRANGSLIVPLWLSLLLFVVGIWIFVERTMYLQFAEFSIFADYQAENKWNDNQNRTPNSIAHLCRAHQLRKRIYSLSMLRPATNCCNYHLTSFRT